MNNLPLKTRKLIIRCLVEGQGIRSTARTAVVWKNTVTKLLTRISQVTASPDA